MLEVSGVRSQIRQDHAPQGVGGRIRQYSADDMSLPGPHGLSTRIRQSFDEVSGINARIRQRMSPPSGFGARVHEEPGGFGSRLVDDHHFVDLHPVDEDYDVAFEPLDDEYDIAFEPLDGPPGDDKPIRLGTMGRTFREAHLNETHYELSFANRAYAELREEVKAICAENGDTYKSLMFLNTTKEVILKKEGEEPQRMTLGKFKQMLIDARVAHGTDPAQAKEDVERQVTDYFNALNRASTRGGISTITHYSAKGDDKRGSSLGKKPMELHHHSHPILQRKQVSNIAEAADKGFGAEDPGFLKKKGWWSRDYDPPLAFIGRIKGADDDETREKQCGAVDKALHTEAFVAQFRKKLGDKIAELSAQARAEPDEDTRAELRAKVNHYSHLHTQLQKDVNLHALYATAYYDDPEECYQSLLRDFYDEQYAGVEDDKKPSFREFCESGDAEPLRRHAADIASTLITEADGYRAFCIEHNIVPKKDHINVFLIQARNGISDFENLGVTFDDDEQDELTEMIDEARQLADDHFSSDELDTRFGTDKAPIDRLKAAVDDPELKPHLGLELSTWQKIKKKVSG